MFTYNDWYEWRYIVNSEMCDIIDYLAVVQLVDLLWLSTGWGKLNGANAVLENFDNVFADEITVHLRTLWSIKINTIRHSSQGATKANDFLCSSILAVLLNHNFYVKDFINKQLLWYENRLLLLVVYLLVFVCNVLQSFFVGDSYLFLLKNACCIFLTPEYNSK